MSRNTLRYTSNWNKKNLRPSNGNQGQLEGSGFDSHWSNSDFLSISQGILICVHIFDAVLFTLQVILT